MATFKVRPTCGKCAFFHKQGNPDPDKGTCAILPAQMMEHPVDSTEGPIWLQIPEPDVPMSRVACHEYAEFVTGVH